VEGVVSVPPSVYDPLVQPRTGVRPREGEIAFAVSVSTLYDLTVGLIGWPVRLTRHSSPTEYTLTLANRTIGGPILNILATVLDPVTGQTELDTENPLFQIGGSGITSQKIGSHIDFAYQAAPLEGPGAGSEILRMYSRGGQLFFKAEDSGEQQIPIGDPPGPSMRWAHWMGGG
jgi:hypothetical protein